MSLLLLTALACGGSSSKPTPSVPGRALAGTANASASAVAPTSDGGFVIAGTTFAGPHGGTDLLLVRIDATGTVLWTQTYGGAGNESGTSVRQTQDGGFVAAGLTDDAGLGGGPGGLYVVRADAAGQLSWQRTYGGVVAVLHLRTVAVRQTRDGGFVVAGTGPGTEPMNPEPDAYLVKTDASGNITWQRTFGGEAANSWAEGYGVEQTADDGYVLVGWREGTPVGSFAVKVDASGATQWEQTFGTLGGAITAVQQTPAGAYIYIGTQVLTSGCATLLVKGDALGQLAWERTVGALTSCSVPVSGLLTSDGGIVVAARAEARNGDAYVVRADASGNELWARTYGGDGGDVATSVVERPGGGFLAVGGTTSFGGTPAVYLLRLDASGAAD